MPNTVLVVGGGLAGLTAAVSAAENGAGVILLCQSRAGYSGNSIVASGGFSMSTPFSANDAETDLFFRDTEKAGAGICDTDLLRQFAQKSDVTDFLTSHGVPLQKTGDEYLKLHSPGHSVPRTLYPVFFGTSYSIRGLSFTGPLLKQALLAGVEVWNDTSVTRLLLEDNCVVGAEAIQGENVLNFYADAVILCCGGGAGVFSVTNNTSDICGGAYRLGWEAGASLRDMEMVQFYPCMMMRPVKLLLQTPLFGEGAVLRNNEGEAFMERYSPAGNMAPRDIMSRAISSEISAGRGIDGCVYLDGTAISPQKIESRYASLEKSLNKFGCSLLKDRILVSPAAHFYMGGLVTDLGYACDVPGLYACGEAAGGLHGANRLSGNALTETVVSGRVAGTNAAACHTQTKNRTGFVRSGTVKEEHKEEFKKRTADLKRMMWEKAAIVRDEKTMTEALCFVEDMRAKAEEYCDFSKSYYSYLSMLVTSQMLLMSAIERKESRGAHYRSDFSQTDDRFLGNFICKKDGDGISVSFSKK